VGREEKAGQVGDVSQQGLFDNPRHMARTTDPSPSHAAAEQMAKGTAKLHREQILELIAKHPGRDCSGLVQMAIHEGLFHLDRASISKRLSELFAAGAIQHPVAGSRARRWFIA
jgi:hypothetical protein